MGVACIVECTYYYMYYTLTLHKIKQCSGCCDEDAAHAKYIIKMYLVVDSQSVLPRTGQGTQTEPNNRDSSAI